MNEPKRPHDLDPTPAGASSPPSATPKLEARLRFSSKEWGEEYCRVFNENVIRESEKVELLGSTDPRSDSPADNNRLAKQAGTLLEHFMLASEEDRQALLAAAALAAKGSSKNGSE